MGPSTTEKELELLDLSSITLSSHKDLAYQKVFDSLFRDMYKGWCKKKLMNKTRREMF